MAKKSTSKTVDKPAEVLAELERKKAEKKAKAAKRKAQFEAIVAKLQANEELWSHFTALHDRNVSTTLRHPRVAFSEPRPTMAT